MRFTQFFILMMFSISIRAQKIQDVFIYPTDNDKILSELLNEKEAEYGVKFVFDRNQMRARTILGTLCSGEVS
jgi:hypothetical protein